MKNYSNLIPNWFKVMLVASVAVVTYGMGQIDADNSNVTIQNNQLKETLWLDKVPEVMHDSWQGYLFTADNVGLAVQAESAFKVTLEIFEFQVRKSNIRWHFPHDGAKANTKFTIEKLKKPTEHFDHKLTIENDPKNGGQTKVYFTGPDFKNQETIERLAPGALAKAKAFQAKSVDK